MTEFSCTFFKDAVSYINISYKLLDSSEIKLHSYFVRPEVAVTLDNQILITPNIKETKENIINKDKPQQHQCGYIITFILKSLVDIELVHFEIKYLVDCSNLKMVANGFQSWSRTRELGKDDMISTIKKSIAWYTQYILQGDDDVFNDSSEKGHIQSSSYTHFRDTNSNIIFLGSLSEHHGYTYFKVDFNLNTFEIYKDIMGKRVIANESLHLIKIWTNHENNAEKSFWDTYATYIEDRRAIKNNKKMYRHVNGWSSWGNYNRDINEAIIMENIQALKKHQYSIDIFQIDEGYQTAIGDWLSISNKFPNGMKVVASKIKEAGFMASLWLAPYAVGFKSKIVKEHSDWLIKDEEGKAFVVGRHWGGFYALNMYHQEVRHYLKQVFDTVLHDWGFDMVKLDFCFAAAVIHRNGKSRSQIMYEAIDFLRDVVGPDKMILGGGVPLASAWRKVDYCRINSDVTPWWEDRILKMLQVHERVSTFTSLISTLSRWAMSDCMFGNDPGAMILCNTNKNKLNSDERYTLCVLNHILGALVFSSDNVNQYNMDEHLLYAAMFPKVVAQVRGVLECRPNVFIIKFTINRDYDNNDKDKAATRYYTTYTNLSDDQQDICLPPSKSTHHHGVDVDNDGPPTHLFFATDNDIHIAKRTDCHANLYYRPSSIFTLKKHQTKTFMHIVSPSPSPSEYNKVDFLGSTSHIVPGTEIETFYYTPEQDIQITFKKENTRKRLLYFGIGTYLLDHHETPTTYNELKVNGKQVNWETIPVKDSSDGSPSSKVVVAVVDL